MGSRTPRKRAILGLTSEFPERRRAAFRAAHYVGISPHAVDQRSDWSAADEYQFSLCKIRPALCGLFPNYFSAILLYAVRLHAEHGLSRWRTQRGQEAVPSNLQHNLKNCFQNFLMFVVHKYTTISPYISYFMLYAYI